MTTEQANKWTLLFKNKITSTSDYAKDLLAKNHQPPFVISANSQSSGRGQKDHTWSSPEGNIYLSIVLDNKNFPLHLIPHKTAVLICEWFYLNYQVRLTIKWPNDLLFAGYKLGGILSECKVHLQKETIIIGIGLNIKEKFLTSSICANEILNKKLPLEQCRKNLINYFEKNWDQITPNNIITKYYFFYIGDNHPWTKKNNDIYISQKISESGQLCLQSKNNPDKYHSLISATHDFFWAYKKELNKKNPPLNIAIKEKEKIQIAHFDHKNNEYDYTIFALNSIGTEQKNILKNHPVFISTQDDNDLKGSLINQGFYVINIKQRPIYSKIKYPWNSNNSDNLLFDEGKIIYKKIYKNKEIPSNTIYLKILGLKSMAVGGIR
jgi:biotin-[acetyl-CoA-carboxylase] ligase BirA-like protein